jgi:glycosyltransferase involved in cell wall biosynthesis
VTSTANYLRAEVAQVTPVRPSTIDPQRDEYPPHVVYVVTHAMTAVNLLRGQLAYLRQQGFDVTLVSSPGPGLQEMAQRESVRLVELPMARRFAAWQDLRALGRLVAIFRQLRPDIVNAGTTKAGLLGTVAACACRVPIRVYLVRGLRYETSTWVGRWLLMISERVAAWCATHVVCVSSSVAGQLHADRLVPLSKLNVLGRGTSNGVDFQRFYRPTQVPEVRQAIRRQFGIDEQAWVMGYVGRVTPDKGIGDLLTAFADLVSDEPDAWLLVVGDEEVEQPLSATDKRRLRELPGVVVTGFVPDAAPLYAAMDLFVFPSYREGFPNAPMEAAAAGLAVVGYRATGTMDAVVDGVTGTLVPVGDAAALKQAIAQYRSDAMAAQRHGRAGQRRVAHDFRPQQVWQQWSAWYRRMLGKRPAPPAVRRAA